jgi:peptidoglycan/LPS O-acetylase OafA/YrhL
LRGGAALIVMLAHYQYIGFLPGVPVFKYSGQCGLMVFFFLSSFLLSHSLATDPNWIARKHLSLIPYSINWIFRIFPLLCVAIALTIWNVSSFFPPSTAFWEALRLSATLGRAPGVLWTIPVELTFYVYLPFILALTLLATRSRLGASALASAYLAWCIAIALARHDGAPASPWMTLGFHHYANSFVGGVLFYALIANGRIRFPSSAGCIAALAPLAFVLALPFGGSHSSVTTRGWRKWPRRGHGSRITTPSSRSHRSSPVGSSTAFSILRTQCCHALCSPDSCARPAN